MKLFRNIKGIVFRQVVRSSESLLIKIIILHTEKPQSVIDRVVTSTPVIKLFWLTENFRIDFFDLDDDLYNPCYGSSNIKIMVFDQERLVLDYDIDLERLHFVGTDIPQINFEENTILLEFFDGYYSNFELNDVEKQYAATTPRVIKLLLIDQTKIRLLREDLSDRKKNLNSHNQPAPPRDKSSLEIAIQNQKHLLSYKEMIKTAELDIVSKIFNILQISSQTQSIMGINVPNVDLITELSEENLSTALGYISLTVQIISNLFDIPLKFRIHFKGSKSFIEDPLSDDPDCSDFGQVQFQSKVS
ncbi:hypothetical protein ROZALSC1DRAFT_22888 [Rozella allomycis CSF55]|uniref:Autophagy-related protein 14 n=1 Tax=Rozella allomycis (strain CSF55) TaxID=988480 RepID=A0A4P9YGY1_ROZAC|nr:hypothetical protein ROZALSC1DRAFT_22888 [Rozella allomycis CSF55]